MVKENSKRDMNHKVCTVIGGHLQLTEHTELTEPTEPTELTELIAYPVVLTYIKP